MRRNEGKISIKDKNADLTLILDKLDRLEDQNKMLAEQNQNLQKQIQELKENRPPR